jgi:uncharacterized protein YlxP (DUF503 family)
MIAIGLITFYLQIPDCFSLKDKRSRVKPLLSRLHREFNISSAEVDLQDKWSETVIACTVVANDRTQAHRLLQEVGEYIETHWPDLPILEQKIEML